MLLGQNSLRRLAARAQTPQPTKLRFAAAEMLSICPESWQDRLAQLANRPHTYLPLQVFNEADNPSQLFQYYLLDTTGFEPKVFTTIFPGVNDHVQLSVTGQAGEIRVRGPRNAGLPGTWRRRRADFRRQTLWITRMVVVAVHLLDDDAGSQSEGPDRHRLVAPPVVSARASTDQGSH